MEFPETVHLKWRRENYSEGGCKQQIKWPCKTSLNLKRNYNLKKPDDFCLFTTLLPFLMCVLIKIDSEMRVYFVLSRIVKLFSDAGCGWSEISDSGRPVTRSLFFGVIRDVSPRCSMRCIAHKCIYKRQKRTRLVWSCLCLSKNVEFL